MPMKRKNIWAPWRLDYIETVAAEELQDKPKHKACFMCEAVKADAAGDESVDHFLLVNDERGVIMLNRYPYTNGHLLVVPHSHLGTLNDLSAEQRLGLMELTALAEKLLDAAMNPQGINVGINIGKAAGAGVPGHLHVHVLPRWSGDTNFMSSVAGLRVIPQSLEKSYEQLKATLERLK